MRTVTCAPWMWALPLTLSTGCFSSSSWSHFNLGASTMVAQPANVAVQDSGSTQVDVWVRQASGTAVTGVSVALFADDCVVVPAQVPVDASGKATLALTECPLGTRTVTGQISYSDATAPLPATTEVNFFQALGQGGVAAGVPLEAQVVAVGSDGTPYVGTVHFASSDPDALLPADPSMTAADHGVLILRDAFVLQTPGPQTVSALAGSTATVLSTQSFLVIAAPGADSGAPVTPAGPSSPAPTPTPTPTAGSGAIALRVATARSAVAGASSSVVVTAVDANGNTVASANDPLIFASSDPNAQLPPAAALASGTLSTVFMFGTAGSQSLTVTSTQDQNLTTTVSNIAVSSPAPAPAPQQIIGQLSARCVDTDDAQGGAAGTQAWLWDCGNANATVSNQQFVYTSGHALQVASASAYCLAMSGTLQAGTPLVTELCDGSTAQQFTVQYTNGSLGTIRPSPTSSLCLTAQNGESGDRVPLEMDACASTTSQFWRFSPGL